MYRAILPYSEEGDLRRLSYWQKNKCLFSQQLYLDLNNLLQNRAVYNLHFVCSRSLSQKIEKYLVEIQKSLKTTYN